MPVGDAISRAEEILPGLAAPEGNENPRWQAIIGVANYIPTNPEEVWHFAARWGQSEDSDLRMAVATCVLEHLLEHHFDLIFPRVEALATRSSQFADTFCSCADFGQAERPGNSQRLEALRNRLAESAA